MACDLTAGYTEPCKNEVGGIKAVYFINYGDLQGYDLASGEISDFTAASVNAYKWDLKGDSSLTTTIQSDRNNGTTSFKQVISLMMKQMSSENNSLVQLLAFGRPHAVVEMQNGRSFMCGVEHGCDVTGGDITTGAAQTDKNGYSVTLTANEELAPLEMSGAAKGDPFAGLLTSTVTIVS